MLTKQTFLQQYNEIKKSYETGTLPTVSALENIEWLIYKAYNLKLIDKNFNEEGIIFLDDDFDISILTEELYYSKMNAIKDNFERANKLPVAEDFIFEEYLK